MRLFPPFYNRLQERIHFLVSLQSDLRLFSRSWRHSDHTPENPSKIKLFIQQRCEISSEVKNTFNYLKCERIEPRSKRVNSYWNRTNDLLTSTSKTNNSHRINGQTKTVMWCRLTDAPFLTPVKNILIFFPSRHVTDMAKDLSHMLTWLKIYHHISTEIIMIIIIIIIKYKTLFID